MRDLQDCSFPFPTQPSTPVNVSVLRLFLAGYHSDIVEFLLDGFSHGFRVGYQGSPPHGFLRNNLSADSNSDAVSASILKELQRGHTAGPFLTPPFHNLHCSPLGSAPKKDGSLRIILDLSSPSGSSVNDGISPEMCHVRYSSFDEAVGMVRAFGTGCYMAKIDIRHAFRLCPVHPDDWPLLGYHWLGKYFVDVCLPFGSRSSPCIFNAFADSLQWILVTKFALAALTHYLDDFFLCAFSLSDGLYKMELVQTVFNLVGVPVALDKLEGPSQVISYLGIEIDSINSVIRLPDDKLFELRTMITTWLNRKKCTKRELLSLIGSLSFACKVIRPGRIFLRRLIDLSTSVSKLHHHIDISSCVRLDLVMWSNFLQSWNGSSFLPEPPVTAESLSLFTDASFTGFGGFFQGQWISQPWPFDVSQVTHISFLELFAVFATVSTFSELLVNKHFVIFTDNEAIVSVWSTGSSKDKQIMALVREMFFLCTQFNLTIRFRHVPGVQNTFADLLSRLQVDAFKSICPGCSDTPSFVHPHILAVLERILFNC